MTTECSTCGSKSGHGRFYPDDEALCRSCYNAQNGRRKPSAGRYVPQARDTVLNEYAAHDAQQNRLRVIENRGGRNL